MKLAQGAETILAARMKGRRPADMVLVSLGDVPDSSNPWVVAKPSERYDWRWVRGLDIGVYMTDADDWPELVKDIALCRPAYLCVWNREQGWGATVYLIPTAKDVDKPVMFWQQELDFVPWMDFQNADFAEGRKYARDEQGMPYAVNT